MTLVGTGQFCALTLMLLGCGTDSSVVDAGTIACKQAADCPDGEQCYFAADPSCTAAGRCSLSTECKPYPVCTCNNSTVDTCGPYFSSTIPFKYLGACSDASDQ